MALTAQTDKSNKSTNSRPEQGTYVARVVGLTDLGHQPGFTYKGNEIPSSYKVEFTYELVDSLMEDGRPHWVSEEVSVNDFEGDGIQSTMMARVRCIDKENDTNDGKDLVKLLTKPCMVTVSLNDKGYPKIKGQAAVSGVPNGMEVKELQNDPFTFDLDDPNVDMFLKFPEFKQNKIRESLNFSDTELAKILAEGEEY